MHGCWYSVPAPAASPRLRPRFASAGMVSSADSALDPLRPGPSSRQPPSGGEGSERVDVPVRDDEDVAGGVGKALRR